MGGYDNGFTRGMKSVNRDDDSEDDIDVVIPWATWLKFERDFVKELTVTELVDYFNTECNDERTTEIFGRSLSNLRANQRWFQTMENATENEKRKRINRIINDRCTEMMRVLALREASFLELLRNVLPRDEMLEDILVNCGVLPHIKNVHYTFDDEINRYRHKVDQKSKLREPWWWCFTATIERMARDEQLRNNMVCDAGLLKCNTLEEIVKLDKYVVKDHLVFSEADDN